MAYFGEDAVEQPTSAVDEVQRLCKQRMEQLHMEMAEMEEMAKRAAARRNALAQEMRTMESILDATRHNEPPRDVFTIGER